MEEAFKHGETFIIVGDFGYRIRNIIPRNIETVTKGGRLLKKWIEKKNFRIVNNTVKWTRCKETKGRLSLSNKQIRKKLLV